MLGKSAHDVCPVRRLCALIRWPLENRVAVKRGRNVAERGHAHISAACLSLTLDADRCASHAAGTAGATPTTLRRLLAAGYRRRSHRR